MKKIKIKECIPIIVALLPMMVGLILWSQLPEQLPSHFGLNGVANDYLPKAIGIVLIPLIIAATSIIVLVGTSYDPKNKGINKKVVLLVLWLIAILANIIQYAIYATALGYSINIIVCIVLMLGALFMALGNYFPKLSPNYTVGIKVPWTLNSQANWKKTHRLAGFLWVLGGLMILIGGILSLLLPSIITSSVLLVGLLSITLVISCAPIAYSFWYFVHVEKNEALN